MSESSYRYSHAAAGYAAEYDDLYASGYFHQLWREIEAPILLAELTALRRQGAERCLDFACGTGRITEVAAGVFPTCLGVDVSTEMLSAAKVRCPTVRFLHADLTSSRARFDLSFDVVTAFRFFLNAEDSLRGAALDGIADVLEPGGVLVASFQWSSTSPAGLLYRLRNTYRGTSNPRTASIAQVKRLFADHGFTVQRVHRYGLWPRVGRHHGRAGRASMRASEALLTRISVLKPATQNFMVVATNGPPC